MKQLACVLAMLGALVTATPCVMGADNSAFPEPSPYPKTWELKFEHSTPKRIVVNLPTTNVPQAYWYMTYTVTNNTDQEQLFLPVFELVTREGKIVRNDKNIPQVVFDRIKGIEGIKFLENAIKIGGQLRLGEDEAKDGVAIWPEVDPRMGHFSVYVQGLSGETATVKGPDGKDVILRKTLQLNYLIRGDEVYPGEDEVNEEPQKWVMR